jgi:UDP-N-acetylmuramoyl-tripeptide--D-alanyl-D-alanine ligase
MKVLEMTELNSSEILKAIGGKPQYLSDGRSESTVAGDDIYFAGVSTDSRTIKTGDLFFALKGEKYDGHEYVNQALAKGAYAAVVSRDLKIQQGTIYKVTDTLKALGDLTEYYRQKYAIKCLAITGSNGKTTTKEMLAACVQTRYKTLKTTGNFNNLIGLPLSLFNLDESFEVGVFEIGMSVPGEIARLAEICDPQIGIFTNIAPVHLMTMGSVEAIARAKFELVERLPDDGTVILNYDDDILKSWLKNISQQVITYGFSSGSDFLISDFSSEGEGNSIFKVNGISYRLGFPGRHNVHNAAAAIASAVCIGCRQEELIEPLGRLKPYRLRSEIFRAEGIVFINDCYNANPVSMKQALDVLADYKSTGRKIAVLGDMLELGDREEAYHVEVGEYASQKKVDILLSYGNLAENYLADFKGAFKKHFDNKKALAEYLKQNLKTGDVVLIKGSRGMALEDISQVFRGQG